MRELRDHVAISIDGGGIRGLIAAEALGVMETHLGRPTHEIARLVAGTSTGSIIAASVTRGLTAAIIADMYREAGRRVFARSLRSVVWPIARYRYPLKPLEKLLLDTLGDVPMAELWTGPDPIDIVITVRDLLDDRTRLIKPWKREYADWKLHRAVLASSAVPTYFPMVDNRYADGGFGAFGNPCYIAAVEARDILGWDPSATTLISLGTGREEWAFDNPNGRFPWQWLRPILDTFLHSANDQQVRLVHQWFAEEQGLDFRRFQLDIPNIPMDDTSRMDELTALGRTLGEMIVGDEFDERPLGEPARPTDAG
jgi:hypothetical protein